MFHRFLISEIYQLSETSALFLILVLFNLDGYCLYLLSSFYFLSTPCYKVDYAGNLYGLYDFCNVFIVAQFVANSS